MGDAGLHFAQILPSSGKANLYVRSWSALDVAINTRHVGKSRKSVYDLIWADMYHDLHIFGFVLVSKVRHPFWMYQWRKSYQGDCEI